LEARGLDEGTLRAQRPDLVICRVSEFGADGPLADWSGSELVNLAAGGMLFLTGSCDRPPVQLAPEQAQLATGLLAAVATLAALYGGEPVTLDMSKQECVAALITPELTQYAYTGAIPAREGMVASMARIEQAQDTWVYAGPGAAANADYQTYARFLEIPELAEDRFATADRRMEHWEEHQALLLPRLREKTAREWTDAAAAWRLTFGLTQSTLDLLDCEQLTAREFFAPVPEAGDGVVAPLAPFLVDGRRPTNLTHQPTEGAGDGPAAAE
ncbi:MAG: CoA transferase, partial [Dehalococcoidia bacterium]